MKYPAQPIETALRVHTEKSLDPIFVHNQTN